MKPLSRCVLIRSIDGWYVADVSRNPTKGSYTNKLQYAKRFETIESANRERCIDNEYVWPL